jgi:hypothetical protein
MLAKKKPKQIERRNNAFWEQHCNKGLGPAQIIANALKSGVLYQPDLSFLKSKKRERWTMTAIHLSEMAYYPDPELLAKTADDIPTADGPLPTDDYQGGKASDQAATDFAEEQRQQGAPVANPSSRNNPGNNILGTPKIQVYDGGEAWYMPLPSH